MKISVVFAILIPTMTLSFILSYFYQIGIAYWDQYFALTLVILLDGLFGVISGTKREGFKTFKALKILKSFFSWILILTTTLLVEKAFPFASWISETFILPVIVFYLISTIKNASDAGFIQNEVVNSIMKNIDKHKNDDQLK